MPILEVVVCGGSRLGPGGHRPPNLAQAPKLLIGSMVISLSRCCLPNDEGPGPPYIFFLEPPLVDLWWLCQSPEGKFLAVNKC